MQLKTLKTIEFDKVVSAVASYAVLEKTREDFANLIPETNLKAAKGLLAKTREAYSLLYNHGASGIYYCNDVSNELKRAEIGSALSCGELLKVAGALRAARIVKTSVLSVKDDEIKLLPEIAQNLFTNLSFEEEISDKIISEDELSDNASPKLFSIRKSIRNLNAKIRDQLNSYMRGGLNKYLQESVVTMRQDRFVIPVKSEYRGQIKGFIHDQSSSGATVFIEPEQVMELNNQLKTAKLDEAEEIHKILADLSYKVTFMTEGIRNNYDNLSDLDRFYASATYSFSKKCTYPNLNDKGIIDIKRGRHPLIDANKVVPVDVSLGKDYNFLLVTGPNTGGKTVTLKLVGLFTLMAMSGLYIPASDESEISVFDEVFCDIGDEQSIEQSLSTFSSHIKNIVNILNGVNGRTLVLLDELGAGTDPEEGSALALAVIEKLLELNCYGIITTHYAKLKEFATENPKIENASVEFDGATLKPLYKLNVGVPGSSNAIEIAKVLGLNPAIISNALSYLSEDKISFEGVIKKAEESRRKAEKLFEETEKIKEEKEEELKKIASEREKIEKEREKIYFNAKQETKRIVADKLSEAEEIIEELKKILKDAELESKEVFRASALKNRIANSKYLSFETENTPYELKKTEENLLRVGDNVYIKPFNAYGIVNEIKPNKKEVTVLIGDMKSVVKMKDIYNAKPQETGKTVKVNRKMSFNPKTELNVMGMTALEAETELKYFIDQAVVNGLEEIKIIHGVGEGILVKTVRNYLKKDKNIKEFRRGIYGEGENGVTIVKLK